MLTFQNSTVHHQLKLKYKKFCLKQINMNKTTPVEQDLLASISENSLIANSKSQTTIYNIVSISSIYEKRFSQLK